MPMVLVLGCLTSNVAEGRGYGASFIPNPTHWPPVPQGEIIINILEPCRVSVRNTNHVFCGGADRVDGHFQG